jgi:hypothetical protein
VPFEKQVKLLANKQIIDVHQDVAAHAPTVIFTHKTPASTSGTNVAAQGFARKMADGSVACKNSARKQYMTPIASTAAGMHCPLRHVFFEAPPLSLVPILLVLIVWHAVAMINRQDAGSLPLNATWPELGLPAGAACSVRDLIGGTDLPKATGEFSARVASHSAIAVRISCS